MSSYDRYGASPGISRTAVIAGSVLALHVLGLWALQSGLLRKAVEVVIPVQVLSEFITPEPPPPPAPPAPPAPPTPPTPRPPQPPKPRPQPAPPKPAAAKPVPVPAPLPLAISDPSPAANAPLGALEPQPPAPPAPAPVAVATPLAPAAPAVTQPSSSAGHLNNPAPAYPAVSRRLGEQGVVLLSVLIGTDGRPEKVEIKKSSGFERLDRQAMETVSRWRFTPGTRGGVPEAMWYQQPIKFVLTQ